MGQDNNTRLWYENPATKWVEALPLGNGKLGAMVFGGITNELLQLNESTLWSGGPVRHGVNPNAADYLPQIRKDLLEYADYSSANLLTKKMQGAFSQSYLPMGDIRIRQLLADSVVSGYRRYLKMPEATENESKV